MKIRFLGTGTSTGVPEIGCLCQVCTSGDPRDKRLRSSVYIQVNDKNLLIDCGPDFRQQMLQVDFSKLDGILITHEHYDHVGGLDDVRPFNRFGTVNLYVEDFVGEAIKTRLPYCFQEFKYPGVPDLTLQVIDNSPFCIDNVMITPIRLLHYKLPVFGYRIGNMAYLTDLKYIPQEEFGKLENLDTLIIDALRKEEHLSHVNLEQSLKLIKRIAPRKTYLIHMSHQMGLHAEVEKELPENVFLPYDGLEIESE